MTRQQWDANPELARGLREAFEIPVVKLALTVWQNDRVGKIHAGANALVLTQTGAALGAQIIGDENCMKRLLSLADAPQEQAKHLEEHYADPNKPATE